MDEIVINNEVFKRYKNKQVHTKVHIMIYTAWIGEINPNEQINHINDNSLDNRLENLYCGSQKDNVRDCFNNNHRVHKLIIYDKKTKQTLTFCPASDFIQYHYNGSSNQTQVKRIINRDWFKERYDLIEYSKIDNIDDYKSVTTNV